MTELTLREIDCVLCEETYTPAQGPEEREKSYRVYCSSCVNWVAIGKSNPLRMALGEVHNSFLPYNKISLFSTP